MPYADGFHDKGIPISISMGCLKAGDLFFLLIPCKASRICVGYENYIVVSVPTLNLRNLSPVKMGFHVAGSYAY